DAERVVDAVLFQAGLLDARPQVRVTELQPPAVAEVLGLGGVQRVVGAGDGDGDARDGDGQVGERQGEVPQLQFTGHAEDAVQRPLVAADVRGEQPQDVAVIGQHRGVEPAEHAADHGAGAAGNLREGVAADRGHGQGVVQQVVVGDRADDVGRGG